MKSGSIKIVYKPGDIAGKHHNNACQCRNERNNITLLKSWCMLRQSSVKVRQEYCRYYKLHNIIIPVKYPVKPLREGFVMIYHYRRGHINNIVDKTDGKIESEDLKLISLQSSPCCQYDHQQDKKEGCACFIRYIKMHGHLSFMP